MSSNIPLGLAGFRVYGCNEKVGNVTRLPTNTHGMLTYSNGVLLWDFGQMLVLCSSIAICATPKFQLILHFSYHVIFILKSMKALTYHSMSQCAGALKPIFRFIKLCIL